MYILHYYIQYYIVHIDIYKYIRIQFDIINNTKHWQCYVILIPTSPSHIMSEIESLIN